MSRHTTLGYSEHPPANQDQGFIKICYDLTLKDPSYPIGLHMETENKQPLCYLKPFESNHTEDDILSFLNARDSVPIVSLIRQTLE